MYHALFNTGVHLEAARAVAIIGSALEDKPKRLRNLTYVVNRIAAALYHKPLNGNARVFTSADIAGYLASGLDPKTGADALTCLDRGARLLRDNVIRALEIDSFLAKFKNRELRATLIQRVEELADTKAWQAQFGGYAVCR
jgi:hypothetical protein